MSVWGAIYSRFSRDMGIDLGTANTLVHVRGRGILLREPSVVAIDSEDLHPGGGPGGQADLGVPGTIVAVRPLKDGVIADFDQTEAMLRYFIHKVHRRKWFLNPQIVIGVPSAQKWSGAPCDLPPSALAPVGWV